MLCSDFKKDYACSFLVESCPSTSVTEFFLLQSLWCKQGIECGEVHASGGRVDFSCFETSRFTFLEGSHLANGERQRNLVRICACASQNLGKACSDLCLMLAIVGQLDFGGTATSASVKASVSSFRTNPNLSFSCLRN